MINIFFAELIRHNNEAADTFYVKYPQLLGNKYIK